MPPQIEELTFAAMLLKRLPELPDAAFVDPEDILCNAGTCRNVDVGMPLYSDENHLTVDGAPLFVPSILRGLDPRQPDHALEIPAHSNLYWFE